MRHKFECEPTTQDGSPRTNELAIAKEDSCVPHKYAAAAAAPHNIATAIDSRWERNNHRAVLTKS